MAVKPSPVGRHAAGAQGVQTKRADQVGAAVPGEGSQMASLTQRTLILAFSQTLNFAVQFLSPVFLVRILDQTAYGQYKEFIVYSSLTLSFISFGIKSNLLYFISVNPGNDRKYVTNTVYLLFGFSLIGVVAIYFLRGYIEGLTTYNFVLLLMAYIFFYQNIDLLDTLFLSKKRSDQVLYWSTCNIIVRTALLIYVAYRTRDVLQIVYLLIALEAAKSFFTVLYLLRKKLLGWRVDLPFLKQQLIYILPLGFAALITHLNTNLSKVIISANLGASALAIYAIGSQNIPILNIISQSVTYVIFPEMAQRTRKDPLLALNLWNQSNVLYVFLLVPCFFILLVYADVLINTLFTDTYSAAIPLFRIYLVLLLRRCFEVGAPLRAMNKNKYFVVSNSFSLAVNIVLLYVLYKMIGFYGPAIAFVTAEVALAVFLAFKIVSTYNIAFADLFHWKKIGLITALSVAVMPILLLRYLFDLNPIAAAVIFSSIYVAVYLAILRKLNIDEVDFFMTKILEKFKIPWNGRKVRLSAGTNGVARPAAGSRSE
ncbi:MAG: polysaccharide biosynthesis protein [Desulfobacteraceae bacterium]|nr:MAG: polysaccharide biosynthesis protein [Desulfobacteraceae bacterium]